MIAEEYEVLVKKRTLGWVITLFLFTSGVVVFSILNAGYYLESPAQFPKNVDLLVALGGGNGGRIQTTLSLYKKGYAKKILITGLEGGDPNINGYYLNWRAQVLLENGVRDTQLLFDAISTNSWFEAKNTLSLMHREGLSSVLVVSDPPHMRRLSWVWSRVFDESDKKFLLIAAPDKEWNPEKWWLNERSAKYVFMEYIKITYYFFKHNDEG